MKAKLIIKMPDCCAQCLVHDYLEHYFGTSEVCRGIVEGKEIDVDVFNEKPDWCPLEPVRERRSKEEIEEALKEAAKIGNEEGGQFDD